MKTTVKRTSLAAEGMSEGNGVSGCVNLVKCAGGLRSLNSDELKHLSEKGNEGDENGLSTGFRKEAAFYPGVILRSKKAGVLQKETGSFSPKSGNPGDGNVMSDSDIKNYSKQLMECYRELHIQASNSDLFIQPIVWRYRLIDKNEKVLFSSMPMIAGIAEGLQCDGILEAEVEKRDDENFTIGSMILSVEAWSLTIEIPDLREWEDVKSIELEMSNELHTVDPTGYAEISIAHISSNQPIMRIGMPGATTGMQSRRGEMTSMISSVLSQCDKWLWQKRRYRAGEAMNVRVSKGGVMSIEAANAQLSKLYENPIEVSPDKEYEFLKRVNTPNGFEAMMSVTSGDTTLHTGIEPLRYKGADPRELMIVEPGNDEIVMESRVILTSGEIVSRRVKTEGDYSTLKANAITGYPGGGVEIILKASCNGKTKIINLPLSPTRDMEMSVNVSENLRFKELEESEGPIDEIIDEPEDVTDVMGNIVMCSTTWDKDVITGATRTKRGGKITAAERSTGSWDSSRGHFYLWSEESIEAITAEGKGGSISITEISSRGSRGEITEFDGSQLYLCEEGIMSVKGGTVKLWYACSGLKKITKTNIGGMLLMIREDGSMSLIDGDKKRYDIRADSNKILWEGMCKQDEARNVKESLYKLRAKKFSGTITLEGFGKGKREEMMKMRVDRKIDEPIECKGLITPKRRMWGLRIQGECEDLKWEGGEIMNDK